MIFYGEKRLPRQDRQVPLLSASSTSTEWPDLGNGAMGEEAGLESILDNRKHQIMDNKPDNKPDNAYLR